MSDEEKKALERIDYIQDFIIENGEYTWKQKYNETFEYFKEELEKEKEKNKKARDMIEYYLIENNSLNDFDKRNKELKKLEKVLGE